MVAILEYLMMLILGVTYIFILRGIIFKNKQSNFVSWILWAMLDIAAIYGTWQKQEDSKLILTFFSGTVIVALVLLFKSQIKWGQIEFLTCILVIGCFIVLVWGSPDLVIWVSGMSLFLAGMPLLKDMFKAKVVDKDTKIISLLFMIAMIISMAATVLSGGSLIIVSWCLGYWAIGSGIALMR